MFALLLSKIKHYFVLLQTQPWLLSPSFTDSDNGYFTQRRSTPGQSAVSKREELSSFQSSHQVDNAFPDGVKVLSKKIKSRGLRDSKGHGRKGLF